MERVQRWEVGQEEKKVDNKRQLKENINKRSNIIWISFSIL
jgi:hypothetical protein